MIDSPYRTHINTAVSKLNEEGTVRRLKAIWWKKRNCDERGKEDALDMDNVGGVFMVLMLGIVIAIFFGFMEFMWNVKKTSIKEKVVNTQQQYKFNYVLYYT